jgi:prepilin-type N-terminal cleavage/methylation domain-containing protein
MPIFSGPASNRINHRTRCDRLDAPVTNGLSRAGFTLAELMIVIAIIAILSSTFIPRFRTPIAAARYAKMVHDLMNLRSIASTDYAVYGFKWAPPTADVGTMPPRWAGEMSSWPKPPCPGWMYDWQNSNPGDGQQVYIRVLRGDRTVVVALPLFFSGRYKFSDLGVIDPTTLDPKIITCIE